jgi:hypothetical protein
MRLINKTSTITVALVAALVALAIVSHASGAITLSPSQTTGYRTAQFGSGPGGGQAGRDGQPGSGLSGGQAGPGAGGTLPGSGGALSQR